MRVIEFVWMVDSVFKGFQTVSEQVADVEVHSQSYHKLGQEEVKTINPFDECKQLIIFWFGIVLPELGENTPTQAHLK